jgi:aminopeptidase 2
LQVAIPDFAAGAMENWGLVTYRTVYLLFDEKVSAAKSKQSVAYVVGHELAHQWFGNLVTMEWWSDLWLNEGFATWVGWLAVDHLFPEWNIWTQFVNDDLQRGLKLDALRSSHPIEVPVKNPVCLELNLLIKFHFQPG